jgi:hypothetical protein
MQIRLSPGAAASVAAVLAIFFLSWSAAAVPLPYKPMTGCVSQGLFVAKLQKYDFASKSYVERFCRSRVKQETFQGLKDVDLTAYEGQRIQVMGFPRADDCLVIIRVSWGIKVLGPCRP